MNAYPLQWPEGWPRTQNPKQSRFDTSLAVARDELLNELRLLGAKNVVINSNMKLRNDGLPYSRQGYIHDVGIAVYFILNGRQQCIPCDKWNHIRDNVQAVRLTVAALRGLERWGAKEMVNAAFRGFEALPDPDSKQWFDVLGVTPSASREEIKRAYRNLVQIHHPDKQTGNTERFQEIQSAYYVANGGK